MNTDMLPLNKIPLPEGFRARVEGEKIIWCEESILILISGIRKAKILIPFNKVLTAADTIDTKGVIIREAITLNNHTTGEPVGVQIIVKGFTL